MGLYIMRKQTLSSSIIHFKLTLVMELWFKLQTVCVTLGRSYHSEVILRVHFSAPFEFNLLFDALKIGWNLMIDSWGLLTAPLLEHYCAAQDGSHLYICQHHKHAHQLPHARPACWSTRCEWICWKWVPQNTLFCLIYTEVSSWFRKLLSLSRLYFEIDLDRLDLHLY